MIRTLSLAAALLLPVAAYAWDQPPASATSNSTSNATGGSAKSASHSNSTSNATGGNAGSNNASINDRGGAAPPALPALSSGTCSGVSGGLSLGGAVFGGGAALGMIDKQCTLRNNILIVDRFDRRVAKEMLKGLDGYEEAWKAVYEIAGQSEWDRPAWCDDPGASEIIGYAIYCQ